jgi:hypothetical protein
MIRQILAGFLLLAFVNVLMGCTVTSTHKVMQQEAQEYYGSISQIVLLDGTAITCKPVGAHFRAERSRIRGRSLNHQPVHVLLANLKECRITPPKTIALTGEDTALVAEVVLHNGLLVTFREPGARCPPTTRGA